MAMRWMGIDGGGTSLRVAIVDDDLSILARYDGDSANPSSIGHDEAQRRIQYAVKESLAAAHLDRVDGVGIGIAGASNEYATDWLLSCLQPVLPTAPIVPSSDMEIALVGGRGQLDGILLLAGTGSVALGIAPNGQRHRVGGWGYLLGDEGSGYWIGAQALQTCVAWADGYPTESRLPHAILETLGLQSTFDLIGWRYQRASQRDVAALAPLVLRLADDADPLAYEIITNGAQHLAKMARHLMQSLALGLETIVFAGSLLTNDTLLSRLVQQTLQLSTRPLPRHSAVVGAALLAKLKGENPYADGNPQSQL